jgi:gamma-glutamyltranspeptidase
MSVAETEMEPLTVPHGTESSFSSSYQKPKDTVATEPDESLESFGSPMDGHRRGRDSRWSHLVLFLASFAAFFAVFYGLNRMTEGSQHHQSYNHAASAASPKESVDDSPCTHNDEDPIMTLKRSSLKEGLKNGVVAADHPVCSEIGLKILKEDGGNAVDAAVAVTLCLGVANPASSGLGGGAFLLVHADETDLTEEIDVDFIDARSSDALPNAVSGKITEVVDCREIAPAAATKHMYTDLPTNASERGGLAVGIPGELKCLELAHVRHGKLPWYNVVQPVYELAASGVEINANLAHEIGILKKTYSLSINKNLDWGLRALLTHSDSWDTAKKEGDILKNPSLIRTLKAIRDGGADAMYKGERAAKLAKDIQDSGGIVTKEDIESYKATLRSPIVAHDINGFSIVGVPPPSSGGAVIIGAARFLASYSTPFAAFGETLSVHRLVEACKHVFSIRMSLSDPDYATEVNDEAVRDLVGGDYMKELRLATLDDATLPLSKYGGKKWAQLKDTGGMAEAADANEGDRRKLARRFGYLEDNGTSHFTVVDKDGNAVSMTTSVNTYFGSNVLSPSLGIVLSNTMDDFATPGRPNYFGLNPSAVRSPLMF